MHAWEASAGKFRHFRTMFRNADNHLWKPAHLLRYFTPMNFCLERPTGPQKGKEHVQKNPGCITLWRPIQESGVWMLGHFSDMNLVYRVGPKTSKLPSDGRDAKFWGSNCHASKHGYFIRFCYIGTPEAPQGVNIGHLWSHQVSYIPIRTQNWTQLVTMEALCEA